MPAPPPQVSILIAVRDAEHTLPRLLTSLEGLEAPSGGFEVVAADNGSRDGSRELLERYRRRAAFPLTLIEASSVRGAGPTRNLALAAARGAWVAVVDADDWIDTAWLTSLLAAARPGRVVVSRRISADVRTGRSLGDPWSGVLRWPELPPSGCTSFLIETDRVRELGGWSEEGSFRTGEDYELLVRAVSEGAELHAHPSALFYHSRPDSVVRTLAKAMAYARDDIAIARRHHADFLTRSPASLSMASPRDLGSLLLRSGARLVRWRHPSALFDLGKAMGYAWHAHRWPGDVALLEQARREGRLRRPLLETRTWPFWRRHLPNDVRLLSFDDGPQPGITDRILDLLARHDQKGTFFVVGRRAERHPDLLRRIQAEGHEIGNHTFDHPRLEDLLDLAETRRQIRATQQTVVRLCGEAARPRWFRPPWGRFSPEYKLVLRQEWLCWALWTSDPRDWRHDSTASSVARTCLNATGPELIDLHDATEPHPTFVHPLAGNDREATVEGMALFLPEARRRRLRCLTLSEAFGPWMLPPPSAAGSQP